MGKHLLYIVVKKLTEQPQTGYGLCREIEISTGHRPSFGSIYPLLEKLSAQGHVSVRSVGRKKVYTLTAKGRTEARKIRDRHDQLIDELISRSRMLCQITGADPKQVVGVLEKVRRGEDPLLPVRHNTAALQDALLKLARNGGLRRNKERINDILLTTRKQLERLA